jgi:hypothetical protein
MNTKTEIMKFVTLLNDNVNSNIINEFENLQEAFESYKKLDVKDLVDEQHYELVKYNGYDMALDWKDEELKSINQPLGAWVTKSKQDAHSNTKRIYTETLQAREYACISSPGSEMVWIPRIDKVYKFNHVDEFIRTFKPRKLSENLKNAITKAYNECGNVTFNAGNGNRTFYFKKG